MQDDGHHRQHPAHPRRPQTNRPGPAPPGPQQPHAAQAGQQRALPAHGHSSTIWNRAASKRNFSTKIHFANILLKLEQKMASMNILVIFR